MSIEAKKDFINEISSLLRDKLTAKDLDEFISSAMLASTRYDVEHVLVNGEVGENYIHDFIEAKRIERLSSSTLTNYIYLLGKMYDVIKIPTKQITTNHLRDFLRDEKERGLEDSTLNNYRNAFSSYFKWLYGEGFIPKNPVENIKAIKCQKKERYPFSDTEMEMIREGCKSIRDRALVHFMASTGCRINEILSLNRDDPDFHSMEVIVLGKGNKERTVYMDEVTVLLLRRYLKSRKDNEPALFLGQRNERLTSSGVRFMLKVIEKKTGVENIHPHRFRRTLATNLIKRGMPIQEVAAILGHAKIDTTMRYVYQERTALKNSYKKYA